MAVIHIEIPKAELIAITETANDEDRTDLSVIREIFALGLMCWQAKRSPASQTLTNPKTSGKIAE